MSVGTTAGGRREGGPDLPGVAGIVPAAGLSTRMGSSKPLLDAGGVAFVQRVVDALSGGGCDPVIVVVRHPDGPEAEMARGAGARVVVNPDPSDGPISSLRAALLHLDSSEGGEGAETDVRKPTGCAFCPVDHPRIDRHTVARLLDVFRESGAPVVVPVYESRRGHPVLLRRTLFAELLEEELPEGARTVVRRHADDVLEVEVEDSGILVDIDTRREYREHYPAGYRETFQDG